MNKSGFEEAIRPGTRKRPRESTPPEELDKDDEDRFQADEKQVATTLNVRTLLTMAGKQVRRSAAPMVNAVTVVGEAAKRYCHRGWTSIFIMS